METDERLRSPSGLLRTALPCFLIFHVTGGNRACGRDEGAFRSPFGNLRVATTGVDFFRSRGNRACGREGYNAFIVKVNV